MLAATAILGIATVLLGLIATLIITPVTAPSDAQGTSAPHADASIPGTPLTVGTDTCAPQWRGGTAGRLTFAVWNNSILGLAVYLQDAATSKIYLEVDNLGANVTRSASVRLPAGHYRFVCVPSDSTPLRGSVESVTGTATGRTPGLVAVTDNELAPALATYLRWVRGRIPGLLADVRALDRDVRRGHLHAARSTWLRGHTRYETLGAAYGVFGEDDTRINALPSTTVPPRRHRGLHGFHRIEALLWSGAPARAIAPETRRLVHAVQHLQADLRTPTMTTVDIGLRAHEILENAIEFELTGRGDGGSHTSLATVRANIIGTRAALAPIRQLLLTRDPALPRTYAWLDRTQRLVDSFHRHSWPALARLTRGQRERLNADMSECVELLSRVAVITDPRRVDGP